VKSNDGRSGTTGASSAWSTAYRANSRKVKRLSVGILRKAAIGMSDDHDDVAQTVFLKLLEIEQTGRPSVEHTAYLLAMARNATLDLLRARRRYVFVPEMSDNLLAEQHTDGRDDAALAALSSYISSLPADLAAVFSLRFANNLPQSLVCKELAISRQSLRTLERRIKNGAVAALSSPPARASEKILQPNRRSSPY
jgi:RNA polymerase sigma factor (sigma-70 family)